MASQLVTALIEQLDPAGCDVINLPDRIWVFGGGINDSDLSPGSLRDCFWRRALNPAFSRPWAHCLDRPEDFDDWWAFSGYSDLLTFERDACFLARAIILFVESPGSIAELGCLASHDSILPRVLAVVQRKYHSQQARQSYLTLGPLRRVKNRGAECIISTLLDRQLPEDDFNAIVETMDDWLTASPQRSRFNPLEPAHVILLIADIVDLLLIGKSADVEVVLSFYGVSIDDEKLEQYLELLGFFGLIQKEVRGREVFWLRAQKSEAPWFDHKGKDDGKFVRARFKIDEAEKYVRGEARLRSVYGRLHEI